MNYTVKFLFAVITALIAFSCSEDKLITEPGRLVPKTVDEDPSLPSITVNGAMLHAEAYGHPDSTLLICIHGGPGGDYRSLLNCKDLASHGYRVVFYDQRGSGLSQRFPKSYYTKLGAKGPDMYYDELNGVIAHYRKSPSQRVYLLGHSWGAILATGYAGKYPNAIQGLVVAEPGGLVYDDIETYVENALSFELWEELMNDVAYLDQFITGKEDQHEILDYKLGMLASRNPITGEDNTLPGSFWRAGAMINAAMQEIGNDHRPDFSKDIDQFDVPVLFLYSEENKAYPDSWAERISTVYNEVTVEKIDDTGHSGIISDRDAWELQTLPEILSYFNSIR